VGEKELDWRIRCAPKYPGVRHFPHGISCISQWTGRDNQDLEKKILPAISGAVSTRVIKAVRAELDFIFTAQYKSHSEETIATLAKYNHIWHENKSVFIDEGARRGKAGVIQHFNIPKVHSRHHYAENILQLGTTDNYLDETPETYHIIYAKQAYERTNKKDFEIQMVRHLSIIDKVHAYSSFLRWHAVSIHSHEIPPAPPHLNQKNVDDERHSSHITIAKRPTAGLVRVGLSSAAHDYGIVDLNEKLGDYVRNELKVDCPGGGLPAAFQYISIWNQFKLRPPLLDEDFGNDEHYCIRACLSTSKDLIGRFDTVLVLSDVNAGIDQIQGTYCRLYP
jgi:hypothetical protein